MKWAVFYMSFSVLGSLSAPAFAQDKCSDVLVNGTFGSDSFKGSDYYQLVQYSHFVQSSDHNSDRTSNSSVTVPIYSVPVTAGYSETAKRQKKDQVERLMRSGLTIRQERDIASYHGDPAVIAAWQACMVQERAGLSVRFKQYDGDPRSALLFLEWFPAIGVNDVKLARDVSIPAGVQVTGGGECFTKGTVISAGIPCVAQLSLESSTTAPIIVFVSDHGPAEAQLPARVKLHKTTEDFPFPPANELSVKLQPDRDRVVTRSFKLSNEQIAEGWIIDQESVTGSVAVKYGGNVGGRCQSWRLTKDLYSVEYSFKAVSSDNASVICDVTLKARVVNEQIVPQ